MTVLTQVNGQDFTTRNGLRYLHLHGHLPPTMSWSVAENLTENTGHFGVAVKDFQRSAGLVEDGRLLEFTAGQMQMPTCGAMGMRGSRSGQCRWEMGCGDDRQDRTDITIHFDPNGVRGVTEKQAIEMAHLALEKWDLPSGFRFVWTDDRANANIQARMKKLGRQILGLAQLPCGASCRTQLFLYMQQTANWHYGETGSFHEVFCHEAGHNVGMEHEDRKPSVMTSSALGVYPECTKYDIGLMVDIYGQPLVAPTPPPIDPIPPVDPPDNYAVDYGILTFYDHAGNVAQKYDVTERVIRPV